MEASIGAVFLDGGFDAARAVIVRLYARRLDALNPALSLKDPKTALQELLQAKRLPLPSYALSNVSGEAHAQAFEVACSVPSLQIVAHGHGSSRRIAEQEAAAAVLERLSAS